MNLSFSNETYKIEKAADASCLVDGKGKIKLVSEKIRNLLPNLSIGNNLQEELAELDVSAILDLLNIVYETGYANSRIVTNLKSKESYLISIKPFYFYNNLNYLLTFKSPTDIADENGKNNKEPQVNKYDFLPSEITECLQLVENNYPFSAAGKHKVQSAIDNLEKPAWLKKSSGRLILINKNYADYLKIDKTFVENKMHADVLVDDEIKMFESLDNYIKSSKKSAKIKSHKLKNANSISEIPIIDIENNISLIFGYSNFAGKENSESRELFYEIRKSKTASLVFKSNREVELINESFINFFGIFHQTVEQIKNIDDFFGSEISSRIKEFLREKLEEKDFYYSADFTDKKSKNVKLEVRKFTSNSQEELYKIEVFEIKDNFTKKHTD